MASRVKYRPDRGGFRQMSRESWVEDAAMEGARAVAAWARANDPDGEYQAQAAGVAAGRSNEIRAGAVVTETVRGRGHFKRTLARAAQEARS